MDIANRFFDCFLGSTVTEVQTLQRVGLLGGWARKNGNGRALVHVLKEDSLRYLALREFYRGSEGAQLEFDTECNGIDVILSWGEKSCAFELKRWQNGRQEGEILNKDYAKLVTFLGDGTGNRHAYSLIYTVNDDRDVGWSAATLPETRRKKYREKDFPRLAAKYTLRRCEVEAFNGFTVCVMMAAPKPSGAGA